MALTNADIKWYLSGGAGNSDATESYGDDISSTEIVSGVNDNLWDDIEQSSRDAGATDGTNPGTVDYRVFYIKIDAAASGSGVNGKFWMNANDGIGDITYRVAVGTKNTTIVKPVDENTAPAGLSFQAAPTLEVDGIALPDVVAGDYIGICVERSISANANVQNTKGPTWGASWSTL